MVAARNSQFQTLAFLSVAIARSFSGTSPSSGVDQLSCVARRVPAPHQAQGNTLQAQEHNTCNAQRTQELERSILRGPAEGRDKGYGDGRAS